MSAEPTHIVFLPAARRPEHPSVAPQRRERRRDRYITLVQLAAPAGDDPGVWQLRDGMEILGHLVATEETAAIIRSALQFSAPFSGDRGADRSDGEAGGHGAHEPGLASVAQNVSASQNISSPTVEPR